MHTHSEHTHSDRIPAARIPAVGEPEIEPLLQTLLARQQTILHARLVGLYLYGSAVTGDFTPGISDVDLLAVLAAPLRDAEFDALQAMHLALIDRYPGWQERLEVLYYPTQALRTFRQTSSPLAVISPGEPFNVKPAGTDWLMNWYFVREWGSTLYGPHPATLIDPIDHAEFLDAVAEHAQHWPAWIEPMRDDCKYQAYGVLTMCRSVYTLHHGEQVSKQRAAHWAAHQWPAWAALILRALAWRSAPQVDADPHTSFVQTRQFVEFAAGQLSA